ncbi:MAG TPA: hypothetical protein VL357_07765 [Rariglobus sp.]|jgi:hypothetical protein|nr:hypothetical protein [Rariglobus sp.]
MIQPPALPPKPVRPRPSWTRLSANPDVRSVQIAVIATICVHLVLLWLAPRIESFVGHEDMGRTPTEADRTFEIQLAPDVVSPPPKPPPIKFVEANPNAPDNVPDKTDNFAAQNQQVAQEKPTPDHKSDAPAVKGKDDPDTTAIVTGQLAEPALATPPAQKPVEKTETPEEAIARKAQNPLSGTEKIEGDNPDGLGSNVAKVSPTAKPSPQMIEGDANAKSSEGKTHGLYYTVDAKHPQPRPTLPANVIKARPSPLRNNALGTDNVGAVSYDAKWSSYGEYLQKFLDTVQVQWDRILSQSDIYPTAGTKVTVVFTMNSEGKISSITKVEGSGGRASQDACVSAITARDPYGAWTDDMISVLGKSQEFTFTFVYE